MDTRTITDEDLENEFRYWLGELLKALRRGAVLAVVTAVLIALLPVADERAEFVFARDMWPYLAEFSFWLAMLASMLWSAARRIIGALTGVMPWERDARLRPSRYPEAD
jgi:hypothetical protein